MILADKIMEERKRNGWSQEEVANQLGVSRQSVSKWESAQSVPDLNRILQMAELFGVTTDYLLKDEIEEKSEENKLVESVDVSKEIRKVSMEEASDFLKLQEKNAPIMALGVSLCILSSVVLIVLAGLSDSKMLGISEKLAGGIGISVLLVMVAIGVLIFIKCANEGEKYDYLNTEEIETAYGVIGMVQEKKKAFAGRYNAYVSIGVALCILSVAPLLVSSFVTEEIYIFTIMVGVLLLIVSVAVNMLVRVGIINGSYSKLLQEKDYTVERKKASNVIGRVSVIYWCVAVAIYLAWSLPTMRWDITWVIWPVAGVLFAVVLSIVKMVIKAEE